MLLDIKLKDVHTGTILHLKLQPTKRHDQLVAVNLENIEKHSPETSVSSTTAPSTVLAVNGSNSSKYAPKDKIITRSQTVSGAAPGIVEQKKPSKPIVCPHCGLEGHARCQLYSKIIIMNLETRTAHSYHDRVNTITHTSNPVTSSLIKLATLNCRSLRKSADPTSGSHFIRYLREQSINLLALQETRANTPQLQDLFHTQFQAYDSIWSPYCGLICLSHDLSFSNTDLSICGRVITTTVSHKAHRFAPITVTVLYAPASRRDRYEFLTRMMQFDCSLLFPMSPSRHVLLGDFNYTYATHLSKRSRRPQAPAAWLNYIASHFVDGVTPPGHSSQPTFLRGTQQSCIDYIFLSKDLVCTRTLGQIHYIQPSWTDHLLLSLRLPLLSDSAPNSTAQVGKGLWRAQPKLASDPSFRSLLASAIDNTVDTLDPSLPVNLKWEELKSTLQRVAKHSARKKAFSLFQGERLLQKKRSGLITKMSQNPDCTNVVQPQLSIVESQLAEIQQYHVDNLALRAELWLLAHLVI
ncbi:hypothetical protein G6F18_012499 [Rhizopus arrhizus]|nr:hypothetical protein G6F19_012508 [Rhizopus arrhizus]KAG0820724.1 hypothetical protein G6F18_012499 [Rhizopus arrhizus]